MLSAEDSALLAEFEKRQDHMYADRTWIAKRYAGVQDDSIVHPEMTFREWEWCCFANEKVPHLLAMIRRLLSEAELRECIACDWVGPVSETVTPKHVEGEMLCPECNDATEPTLKNGMPKAVERWACDAGFGVGAAYSERETAEQVRIGSGGGTVIRGLFVPLEKCV